MNRDELADLAALQRNLGWKILCREFQRRRENAVAFAMNPDTPLPEVERQRWIQRGVAEVLAWPTQQIEMAQPVDEMVRAGIMVPPGEEE